MSGASATVVVHPGTDTERAVPVHGRLVIGRECAGVDDAHRLVLSDDDAISREHLEIRLDIEHRRAVFIDMSTNGTRLNGTRVERAVPVPLRNGDRLAIGNAEVEFRSALFVEGGATDIGKTSRYVTNTSMVLVVGDIVGYSTLSEQTDSTVVLAALGELWDGLRRLLAEHGGTLNSYAVTRSSPSGRVSPSWSRRHAPSASHGRRGATSSRSRRASRCRAPTAGRSEWVGLSCTAPLP